MNGLLIPLSRWILAVLAAFVVYLVVWEVAERICDRFGWHLPGPVVAMWSFGIAIFAFEAIAPFSLGWTVA